MDIEYVKTHNMLLLDCISGSRAYGLHTPLSDTDKKGVYLLPKRAYYGLEYTEQVNNETNDEVYYELRRLVELLLKNNPNILELLNTPADCILHRHPIMDLLQPHLFLSRLCRHSFAGYAQTQIKKAKGLNKKILNPMAAERKLVPDFCHIIHGHAAIPLTDWLNKKGWQQQDCGLVNITHMHDVYAVYHNSQLSSGYLRGICSGADANGISLSPVEEGISPVGIMSFNKDGYSKYCKDYREYREWEGKRNEARYESTLEHGKNYDAKNMMHTFRLLHMAEEIAREGRVIVRRTDREYLLQIRSGFYSYDELVVLANEKLEEIDELYAKADLPEEPNRETAEAILIEMRERLYAGGL